MRKWTYLVAALLSAGVTVGTFSSCIDNDEPEGINILRKAKAELISAKKALAEAEAEKAKADAQKTLIEAECEKARVEIGKLQAEAKTEQDKLLVQQQIAQIQQQMEIQLKEAEIMLKTLEAQYETVVTQMEKAKLELSAEYADALDVWYRRYTDALAEYNKKYEAYIKAQRAYTKALMDPDAKDFERGEKLRDAVTKAQMALDQANADVARLEKEIEEAKDMTPTDLGKKYTDLMNERKENQKAIAQIEMEKAEALREADLEPKIKDADAAVNEAKDKEIEIAKFVYNFKDLVVSDPSFSGDYEVVREGLKFRVIDAEGNTTGNYDSVKGLLENFRNTIQSYLLDEDDMAWTQARVNELKTQIPAAEKKVADYEKLWQTAVNAYNEGKGYDLTKFSKTAAVETALTAFNATIDPLNKAKADYAAALKTLETETKNWDKDEIDAVWANKVALEEAEAERHEAVVKAAEDEFEDAVKELTDAVTNASYDLTKAKLKLAAATASGDENAIRIAKANVTSAENLYKSATDLLTSGTKIAQDTYNKAIKEEAAENASKLIDIDIDFQKEMAKIVADGVSNADASKYDAAQKNVAATKAEFDKQKKEAAKKFEPVQKAVKAFVEDKEVNTDERSYATNKTTSFINSFNSIQAESKDNFKEAALTDVVSVDVKDLVIAHSNVLYGTVNKDAENDDQYGDMVPSAHLTKYDKAKLDALIKAVDPKVTPAGLKAYYDVCGLLGAQLKAELELELASAYLANPDVVNDAVASVDEALKALETSKDEQAKVIAEAEEALQALEDQEKELTDSFDNKSGALAHENTLIEAILKALLDAAEATDQIKNPNLNDYTFGEALADNFNEDTIKKYVETLQGKLDTLVNGSVGGSIIDGNGKYDNVTLPTLHDLKDALERAQIRLKAWESGELTGATAAKYALEDAEFELNQAKEIMEYYKADLDKAIARLEAAE